MMTTMTSTTLLNSREMKTKTKIGLGLAGIFAALAVVAVLLDRQLNQFLDGFDDDIDWDNIPS